MCLLFERLRWLLGRLEAQGARLGGRTGARAPKFVGRLHPGVSPSSGRSAILSKLPRPREKT